MAAERQDKVVAVGQGYVGLPLAMRAVGAGFDVVGLEVDEQRVKWLAAAESYVEDVAGEELAATVATGRYRPSSDRDDCAGFSVAVITVPTPLAGGKSGPVVHRALGSHAGPLLRPGSTVVLESTTYPGTTEELVAPLLDEGSGLVAGDDYHLGYSPERIDPGNKTWNLVTTPKGGVRRGRRRTRLRRPVLRTLRARHPPPAARGPGGASLSRWLAARRLLKK